MRPRPDAMWSLRITQTARHPRCLGKESARIVSVVQHIEQGHDVYARIAAEWCVRRNSTPGSRRLAAPARRCLRSPRRAGSRPTPRQSSVTGTDIQHAGALRHEAGGQRGQHADPPRVHEPAVDASTQAHCRRSPRMLPKKLPEHRVEPERRQRGAGNRQAHRVRVVERPEVDTPPLDRRPPRAARRRARSSPRRAPGRARASRSRRTARCAGPAAAAPR